MKEIRDSRILIENKPLKGLDGSLCVGSIVEEIKLAIDALGSGFCLDFGHAIAAANSHHRNPILFLRGFLDLKPTMYHLTDGDLKSELDSHLPYGRGNYPIPELFSMIEDGALVTDEASRTDPERLDEYLADRAYATTNAGASK